METARAAAVGEGAICVSVLNNNYKHIPQSKLAEKPGHQKSWVFYGFIVLLNNYTSRELQNVGHVDKHNKQFCQTY